MHTAGSILRQRRRGGTQQGQSYTNAAASEHGRVALGKPCQLKLKKCYCNKKLLACFFWHEQGFLTRPCSIYVQAVFTYVDTATNDESSVNLTSTPLYKLRAGSTLRRPRRD